MPRMVSAREAHKSTTPCLGSDTSWDHCRSAVSSGTSVLSPVVQLHHSLCPKAPHSFASHGPCVCVSSNSTLTSPVHEMCDALPMNTRGVRKKPGDYSVDTSKHAFILILSFAFQCPLLASHFLVVNESHVHAPASRLCSLLG